MHGIDLFKTCPACIYTVFLIVPILKRVFSQLSSLAEYYDRVARYILQQHPLQPPLHLYSRRLFSFCSPCTNSLLIMLYSPTLRPPCIAQHAPAHYSYHYFFNKSGAQRARPGNRKKETLYLLMLIFVAYACFLILTIKS